MSFFGRLTRTPTPMHAIRPLFRSILPAVVGAMLAGGALSAAASPATISVDAVSGVVIAEDGAGRPHHPASLTKLMTAYVAFRAITAGEARSDDTIVVSDTAAAQGGSVLGLRRGDRIALGAALKAMIVRSANDAAVAVAEHLAGGEAPFAERMTAEARRLGMGSTSFRNATGMTAPGHVTTPRDMAVLALAIERDFSAFMPLFASRDTSWKGRTLPTVNGFLGGFAGAEGMKTGFTCPAGYNLVALAHRGGRRAVAVVMGAGSSGQRLATAQAVMTRALAASIPEGGRRLAALPNGTGAPPDLSSLACGGRSGGVGAQLSTRRQIPAGWALEVAFGRDVGKVRRDLATVHRELARRLGGGAEIVVVKPRDGALRYRGFIVGLDEKRAIDTCLAERARAGEERCLVLTPGMLNGALEDERRFLMIAAH